MILAGERVGFNPSLCMIQRAKFQKETTVAVGWLGNLAFPEVEFWSRRTRALECTLD